MPGGTPGPHEPAGPPQGRIPECAAEGSPVSPPAAPGEYRSAQHEVSVSAKAGQGPGGLIRAIGVRRIRLASGLVLFTYLLTHYINHALGNISLAAMEAGLEYHVWLWQSRVGTLVLYSALAVHASLGLWALYERRHFRFKASEAIQLIFGLSIPLLLRSTSSPNASDSNSTESSAATRRRCTRSG